MIEQMKMLHIVASASGKEEMLKDLREMGLLHLAEKQSASRELNEEFQTLSKASNALKEYADPKAKEKKAGVLSDSEFEKMYRGVRDAIEKKESLNQAIGAANIAVKTRCGVKVFNSDYLGVRMLLQEWMAGPWRALCVDRSGARGSIGAGVDAEVGSSARWCAGAGAEAGRLPRVAVVGYGEAGKAAAAAAKDMGLEV